MAQDTLEMLSSATASIFDAKGKDGLLESLQMAISAFGFGSFSLGCHKADKYDLVLNPTLSSWPATFLSQYARENWADFDPILERAANAEKPFSWHIDNKCRSRREQSYIDFLQKTPLKGGVCIPLPRRPGKISCISVESHKDRDYDSRTLHSISIVAGSAALKAELLGLCPETSIERNGLRKLSEKQADILKWASEGKSNADIAVILDISERMVKYHMSEMLRKLGVATRAQAAAILSNENG